MKKYENRPKEIKEYKVLIEISCDLCGKSSSKEWKDFNFDATQSLVYLKTGEEYPEGGYGDKYEIDICPSCFKNKLIPWVESQGGQVTETEWDY